MSTTPSAEPPAGGERRPRVVLDCDPGHDDAIAIVVAARHTELVGITTVAGNAPLDRTTHNALVVRDLAAPGVPVVSGAARPIVAEPVHAAYVHGASGMDGADLPEPSGPPDGDDAVGFIVEACRAEEGTWLVPTGPLTNVALALRAAPDLAHRIAGISLMGGGTFGNRTAAAEFNIWCDPEAAAVVFDYGGPLIMCGLHVTHGFLATPQRIARVREVPGRLPAVLADLLAFFSDTYVGMHDGLEGAPVHDPCAVMAVTHPHLFESRDARVSVETHGVHTRGATVIDARTLRGRPAPNCRVLDRIDAEAGFAIVHEAIAHAALAG